MTTIADPVAAAQAALLSAGLTMPATATDVTIDQSPYENFRDVARIRFVVPRADVLAMCTADGSVPARSFALMPYQKDLLGVSAPAAGDELCSFSDANGRGVIADVLVPVSDPAAVRVAVYQIPS